MFLTDRIRLSGPESTDPEDFFSSSLGVIFPDDIMNQHGDKDSGVIYTSPRYGELELSLCDPEGDDSRKLFSHFLWNSGVQISVFLEDALDSENGEIEGLGKGVSWAVQGKRVLEVGAGTGLGGIVATLAGADEVVISDYPAPEVLKNIQKNVDKNIPEATRKAGQVCVQGHEWGVFSHERDGGWAEREKCRFDRIIVADCLWMPWQHGNLRKSIAWFLAEGGRAWVVGGFHTGRERMRGFFEAAELSQEGLEVERIWERNAAGTEREWAEDRGNEDITERKRWLVIAIVKRLGDP
jgi:nicotinamide N-methyltransferase